jgi:apolipoprotein D and lipocalin family protein
MNARTKKALIVGGALLAAATVGYGMSGSGGDLTTVPSVDLGRYTGRWYEIARYPNRFQKQCSGDVIATYRQLPNGKIEVLNACRKADGKVEVAKGKARVGDTTTNAKLRVTFFWPFYGDYWIIGLDPGYRWAVVGEPSRKYLWILSRSPQLSAADHEEAISIIRAKGYDPSRLVQTSQSKPK